jgi:uncharacterized protein (TIGR02996 family)
LWHRLSSLCDFALLEQHRRESLCHQFRHMTERDALISAARAHPDDRTARLVFADWLEERDDPLGGYVRAEAGVLAHEVGSYEWCTALLRLRDQPAHGGWEYATDLARIAQKIDQLCAQDTERRVFGAQWADAGHEYRLNAPPVEADVIDFELRHGLSLPGEYRAFLLRVGNGRVGPNYGLHTLDCSAHRPELSAPFGPTVAEADAIATAVRAARETRDWEPVPETRREWYRRGYLPLGDAGHGDNTALVLNGPMRGELWAEGEWFVPIRDGKRAGGFLAWYESWLDQWLTPGALDCWKRAPR